MNPVRVRASLRSLSDDQAPFEADFVVETGVCDSMAPRSALLDAGIGPVTSRKYQLPNCEVVTREVGFARLSLMGDETVFQVVLGPDDAQPYLGSVAVLGLGLAVDPITKTLVRLHAKPLKRVLSFPTHTSPASNCHDHCLPSTRCGAGDVLRFRASIGCSTVLMVDTTCFYFFFDKRRNSPWNAVGAGVHVWNSGRRWPL